ncbi:metabolite-proton symporter [Stackebrandtia endophytica]|uniref:Putative proline/betaine transporter n=1 Tax=Stackebrandtia endophytica TaxID=1496996 RepID=A0A543AYF6_9ACTN|nr:MFS transporter [Stackebrandtia endophytica]TQL77605.1 metabolite-proton symporter [Stackebrandtia endophytica]
MRNTPVPTSERPSSMRRVVAASVFGTALETYDLYLYGTAAALVFGPLFFPDSDPTAATLLSLSTFAVSFLARPLGALVFGHFGDRIGRKKMLYVTYLIMGVSTFLIGLLPTFNSIGVLAPVLLVGLRFAQGFGFGGEYSGAVLMLTEHAPAAKRGFYAGLNNIGPVIGFVSSSGLFLLMNSILTEADFLAWGWRIPFLVSILLVVIGLYVRTRVSESPVFEQAQTKAADAKPRVPIAEVLRNNPKQLLLATGANISQFAVFYLFSVYTLSYGVTELGLTRTTILWAVIIAILINLIAIPYASALSDRIGRRKVLTTGFVITIVWAFPFFALFNTGNFILTLVAFMVMMVGYSFVYGPIAAFMSEIFPTAVRFTGSAVAYNLAGILGAAFAPIIATMLMDTYHSSVSISLYIIAITLVSAICVLVGRETRDIDLTADNH